MLVCVEVVEPCFEYKGGFFLRSHVAIKPLDLLYRLNDVFHAVEQQQRVFKLFSVSHHLLRKLHMLFGHIDRDKLITENAIETLLDLMWVVSQGSRV